MSAPQTDDARGEPFNLAAACLRGHAEDPASAGRPAFTFVDGERIERWTYAEAWAEVQRIARGLVALGLVPGDRVLVRLPHSPAYAFAFFGANAAGLVPIIEPEVDINSPEKSAAEDLLKAAIAAELAQQPADQPIMLKLTLPNTDNFYADFVKHPSVLRVVALSGGYSREDANAKLSRNNGMIASFSRALTEGLSAKQSEADFNAMLDSTIAGIYAASIT